MARWQQIVESAPDFAADVRRHLDARVHKTIATLRADGSPRISGIESFFADGDLWFGSMPNARKALDLRRDTRFALHSGSIDPPEWEGDAKVAGVAEEVTDPRRRREVFGRGGSDPAPSDAHLFRVDVNEVVLVALNEARDRLVIQLWRDGRLHERVERT